MERQADSTRVRDERNVTRPFRPSSDQARKLVFGQEEPYEEDSQPNAPMNHLTPGPASLHRSTTPLPSFLQSQARLALNRSSLL